MENQGLSVTGRLEGWRKYAVALGEDFVSEALGFAEDCYLAFEIRPGRLGEYLPSGLPKEAIISVTRFGDHRPRGRPPDARPAEHAAHWLKRIGVDDAVVADYLRALHPWPTLDRHEIDKRLRACEQRVAETAEKAARLLLAGATEAGLEDQLREAEQLEAEIRGGGYSGSAVPGPGELVATVLWRMQLVSRIKAGEFADLAPIVFICTRHPLGRDLAVGSGESFKISWGRHALRQARADAAALVSVPGWYPYWEVLPRVKNPPESPHDNVEHF